MLNQAYETTEMNLQLFADSVESDGSDLFFETEPTSDAEEMSEESPEQSESEPTGAAGNDSEEEPEGRPEGEDKAPDSAAGGKLRVKYNGEEKEITSEEAVTLAQKGMNYDKVAQERDALRATDVGKVAAAATEAGMTVPDFLKYVVQQRSSDVMNSTLTQVMQEYPTLDAAAAEEMARLRIADKLRVDKEAEREAERQAEAEKGKVWVDFVQRYPQYKDVTQFPPPVLEEIQAGASPTEAMQRFELAEQKKEIERLKAEKATEQKNKENKQKSAGSAASTGLQDPTDAFILGLLGD